MILNREMIQMWQSQLHYASILWLLNDSVNIVSACLYVRIFYQCDSDYTCIHGSGFSNDFDALLRNVFTDLVDIIDIRGGMPVVATQIIVMICQL